MTFFVKWNWDYASCLKSAVNYTVAWICKMILYYTFSVHLYYIYKESRPTFCTILFFVCSLYLQHILARFIGHLQGVVSTTVVTTPIILSWNVTAYDSLKMANKSGWNMLEIWTANTREYCATSRFWFLVDIKWINGGVFYVCFHLRTQVFKTLITGTVLQKVLSHFTKTTKCNW
jgi:hypothetical protein